VQVAPAVVPFEYGDVEVRTIVVDGEPWFVAADVCAVLGIANSRDALTRLDEADIRQTDVRSGGQNRQVKIVNESGLCDLIIRSDKPQAKPFRRWVTSEGLPSIRKTGSCGTPALPGGGEPGQLPLQLLDFDGDDVDCHGLLLRCEARTASVRHRLLP